MCAILDANVIHEVFGDNQSEAGEQFYKWLTDRNGRIVVCKKLLEEMCLASNNFTEWADEALRSGKMRREENQVRETVEFLRKSGECKSNDHHIIALARISGARVLYSRDRDLHQDFKNKQLINRPRGSIYSSPGHKHLLEKPDLCRA